MVPVGGVEEGSFVLVDSGVVGEFPGVEVADGADYNVKFFDIGLPL